MKGQEVSSARFCKSVYIRAYPGVINLNIKGESVMKKFFKKMVIGLTAAMMTLSLAACGGSKDEGTAAKDDSAEQAGGGKIVFGTNAEFPPFEFVAGSGTIDQYDGIDIAIAKQIGTDIGKEATINNMEFDSLLIALQNGQIDAVIAGMTVTDERKEAVDFSTPYYTATQVMIVKEDSDVTKAADIADKKIVVIQGYTGETVVKEMGYKYEAFKKGSDAIMELVNGKCDVVVIDSATADKYVKDNAGLKIVEDNAAFGEEKYAIAVKKGNTELLDQINSSIQKMLDDGTISDLSAKYLDVETEE